MNVSSNTTSLMSLLVLMSLMSIISGAWIDIINGGEGKSPLGAAVDSGKQTAGVCGIRPYDYLFDESRQLSVRRNDVGDLKAHIDQNINKIVGGNIAVHGEFPWQARIKLLYLNGSILINHECGAVVISEHWLLSASHCFEILFSGNNEEFVAHIIVGDNSLEVEDEGEQEFAVERFIIYEEYDFRNNDIALIKIRPTSDGFGIQFNSFVQPACLPDTTTSYTEGTKCLISGWGSVKHEWGGQNVSPLYPILLQGAEVQLVHQTVCKDLYGRLNRTVTDNMICAGYVDGGVDVCFGDSGGPLVSKTEGVYTLYGLTSWGSCATPGAPGVFARVSVFLPWIKSNINAYSKNIEQGTLPSKP